MTTPYQRVIPRDLFNESKLLKCIGRLTLLIHDGKALNDMSFEQYPDGDPFYISLEDDGYLSIDNIRFEVNGVVLMFKCQYNSKANYPLYCEYDYCDYLVFDEQGEYTHEFIKFCNSLK